MSDTATRYTKPFSLESITDEPAITKASYDPADYDKVILASWEKYQSGHQQPSVGVTIPAEAIAAAQTRFRQAAARLNVGVAFGSYDHTDSRGKQIGLQPGHIRLLVQARVRKQMPPRTPEQKAAMAAKRAERKAAKASGVKVAAPAKAAAPRQAGLPRP